MTAKSRTIALRDGAVVFEVVSAGQGTPLLYFHSIHERQAWSPSLERLTGRYAVHAPLHPGAGGSTGVETLEDVFDLTLVYEELLDALGIEAAHLVGHFFGGMVAAELAAVFPERVRRLVLISPLGLWRDDAPSADQLILPADELPAALWSDPQSEAARRWAEQPESDEEKEALLIESVARRAAIARFIWPIPDRGLRKRLHRIQAPTLLLWGEADRANPVVYAEEWQRLIKGAAIKLVPGGHMLVHETPDATARLVEEFLT